MRRLLPLVLFPLLACVPLARAADEPVSKPATALTVALISNRDKDVYPLNPDQSGEAFRKSLAGNGKKPPASKVGLALRVTNPTDHDIVLNWGGDDSNISLTLTGEGAVTVADTVPMTREFRTGKATTIGPGKSFDIALDSLSGGLRGVSQLSWFTEVGEYRLSATLTYAVGESQTKVVSDPITIKVTKAEGAK
jgi:hypothetical protein